VSGRMGAAPLLRRRPRASDGEQAEERRGPAHQNFARAPTKADRPAVPYPATVW